MTITTLILLLTTGIVAVTLVHGSSIIKNCCNVATKHYYFSTDRKPSTVYTIVDLCGQGTKVQGYCDTITDGGGWLVIQRRQDGSVNFNRFWWEFEMGFGTLASEFWYGLRALHCLTGQGGWEMRIDIKLANGTNIFLQYEHFKVASAKDKYKLTVGGFQGTTTDPMAYHNGMNFTTRDSDNDQWDSVNCAQYLCHGPGGGWWYNGCINIQPNVAYKGTYGVLLNSKWHIFHFIEMKIRPHNCNI